MGMNRGEKEVNGLILLWMVLIFDQMGRRNRPVPPSH